MSSKVQVALVLGCRRNGLGVIRALGEMNVRVIAVDHENNAGLFSRYVWKREIISSITEGEEKFIREILEIGKKYAPQHGIFLLPMSDIYLELLSENWERFKENFVPVFEIRKDVLLRNVNKTHMYKTAELAGIDYPRTFYNIHDVSNDVFPVVIKPDQRRANDILNSVFRIKKCQNSSELENAVNQLGESGTNYVIQQYIPGGDDTLYTAGVFANKGKLKAICCGRKLRQFPPQTGQCSYGELVNAPDLIKISEKFLDKSEVTGICQIEFKKCQERYYLMEINPRSWSWNSLTTYGGVNLPYIACKDLAGEGSLDLITQDRVKGKWMFAEHDFISNVLFNRNVNFFKWFYQFVTTNERAHFKVYDPVPYVIHLFNFIRIAFQRVMRKMV